ncbi:MAG: acetyl-CoA carboxylase carboxyl transferase subunit beta [Thermoleophilia bacterium]|nr:acetyl-CoA carboxylase carboxyl transferase subunit beta [Thermoleophilia bacterium]
MAKYVTIRVPRREPPPPPREEGERCKNCTALLAEGELVRSLRVCPYCGYHYPMPAHERITSLADEGTVSLIADEVRPVDALEFFDTKAYPDRLAEAVAATGLSEAFVAALCAVDTHPVALGVLDFRFLGGSMGSVVGERFYRLARAAVEQRRAMVVVASSGGARMQEGVLSLMQMAKTVVAVQMVGQARLPYITVLTHPTTGGVFASFATVADVIMAEPGAVMSFAGPRVIEQTTREKLPPGFGSSESQLVHGQVDMVVDRRQLRDRLAQCLYFLGEGGRRG